MDIKQYIQENYERLRNILKKEWEKKYPQKSFDEDIFHNTLMRCMYTLTNESEIDDSIITYIITSFKMNILRETQYSYNKTKKEIEDMNNLEIPIEDFYQSIDTQNIIKNIKENFGKEYTKYFILWCKGYSIKELEEHFGIHNLYYKFNLIKKSIKNFLK